MAYVADTTPNNVLQEKTRSGEPVDFNKTPTVLAEDCCVDPTGTLRHGAFDSGSGLYKAEEQLNGCFEGLKYAGNNKKSGNYPVHLRAKLKAAVTPLVVIQVFLLRVVKERLFDLAQKDRRLAASPVAAYDGGKTLNSRLGMGMITHLDSTAFESAFDLAKDSTSSTESLVAAITEVVEGTTRSVVAIKVRQAALLLKLLKVRKIIPTLSLYSNQQLFT
jgi:hypothetical protein